jgi:ribosome-associated protein
MEFKIKGEFIELTALLKVTGMVDSGGEAGTMILEGYVKRNGEIEFRKRAKIKPGDIIEFRNQFIKIV